MAINAPDNVINRALEMNESGKYNTKTDICEAIKKELGYELFRGELVEIILADKDKKIKS